MFTGDEDKQGPDGIEDFALNERNRITLIGIGRLIGLGACCYSQGEASWVMKLDKAIDS
jgi:S-adenosylhomocysteine hydrolase